MKNGRILIIEDDRVLRRASEVALKKEGYTVLTAVDGEEGIRKARSEGPNLILLDLLMPKLTGIETLIELKKNEATCSIPVVIFSNSSIGADVQKAKALGAIDYLVKGSLSLRELGDHVLSYLEETGKAMEVQN